MTFEELKIIPLIQEALQESGYNEPMPIQAISIPVILGSRDVIGCAQTGTGKTAAFAIPILQKITAIKSAGTMSNEPEVSALSKVSDESDLSGKPVSSDKPKSSANSIKALILTPTRELAIQIDDCFEQYGKYLPDISHTVIFGGVAQDNQVRLLTNGVDILVATPGRLLDLVWQKYIDFGGLQVLVLDEADRMLDMGFAPDVQQIVSLLPSRRQTLLFSATMPKEIQELAGSILNDPVRVEADPSSSTVEDIRQFVCYVPRRNKSETLKQILGAPDVDSALVFTRTKSGADKVSEDLKKSGIDTEVIHGDKNQISREHALRRFKSRRVRILVATDVAARGLDISELSHVINYDVPHEAESYVHRIGRTGRAGAKGIAITLCSPEERKLIADIEALIIKRIPALPESMFNRNRAPFKHQPESGAARRYSNLNKSGTAAKTGPRLIGKTAAVQPADSRRSGKSGLTSLPAKSGMPGKSDNSDKSSQPGYTDQFRRPNRSGHRSSSAAVIDPAPSSKPVSSHHTTVRVRTSVSSARDTSTANLRPGTENKSEDRILSCVQEKTPQKRRSVLNIIKQIFSKQE